MPQFAANLSMMFTERPFLERFAAAAEAGFTAVEFLFPYDHPPEAIAERLRIRPLIELAFGPLGLTNSFLGLVLGHAALGAPFVLVSVLAALQQFDAWREARAGAEHDSGDDLFSGVLAAFVALTIDVAAFAAEIAVQD